jgi:hypothetical protein
MFPSRLSTLPSLVKIASKTVAKSSGVPGLRPISGVVDLLPMRVVRRGVFDSEVVWEPAERDPSRASVLEPNTPKSLDTAPILSFVPEADSFTNCRLAGVSSVSPVIIDFSLDSVFVILPETCFTPASIRSPGKKQVKTLINEYQAG